MANWHTRRQYARQKFHTPGYDVARADLRDAAKIFRLRPGFLHEGAPTLAEGEQPEITNFVAPIMTAGLFRLRAFADGVVVKFLGDEFPDKVFQHAFVFPDHQEPKHYSRLVSKRLQVPIGETRLDHGFHEIADNGRLHEPARQLFVRAAGAAILEWDNVTALLHVAEPAPTPEHVVVIPEQRTVDITAATLSTRSI